MEKYTANKTVLITGASSGIGLSFAKIFAREGYSLILVSRDENKLQTVKQELEKNCQQKISVIAKDLSLPTSAQEVFDEVQKLGVTITALVNNAGWGDYGSFEESNLTKQLNMIDLNIQALTELTYLFLPMIRAQKVGYILNVSSILGFVPGPFMSVYAATKAYVLSFSEAIREELRGTTVSVTTLAPGQTKTNFFRRTLEGSSETIDIIGMNADDVASIGYNAMIQKKSIVVAGAKNKLFTFFPRFLPRETVAKIARWMITK
jgi:short-subunit dehydrogenase